MSCPLSPVMARLSQHARLAPSSRRCRTPLMLVLPCLACLPCRRRLTSEQGRAGLAWTPRRTETCLLQRLGNAYGDASICLTSPAPHLPLPPLHSPQRQAHGATVLRTPTRIPAYAPLLPLVGLCRFSLYAYIYTVSPPRYLGRYMRAVLSATSGGTCLCSTQPQHTHKTYLTS